MERFEFEILDKDRIEIRVKGREWMPDQDASSFDIFTEIKFEIEPKELLTFKRFADTIAFAWSNRFKCRLDSPECH